MVGTRTGRPNVDETDANYKYYRPYNYVLCEYIFF